MVYQIVVCIPKLSYFLLHITNSNIFNKKFHVLIQQFPAQKWHIWILVWSSCDIKNKVPTTGWCAVLSTLPISDPLHALRPSRVRLANVPHDKLHHWALPTLYQTQVLPNLAACPVIVFKNWQRELKRVPGCKLTWGLLGTCFAECGGKAG